MTKHLGHVTLSGDRAGINILEEERPGRRLVIAPITYTSANPAHGGARDTTTRSSRRSWPSTDPFLPPDGQG
jgi:hypothetical protein